MGEIVDLEGYRRLHRRREAEAKKDKRDDSPGAENDQAPSAPSTAERAETAHSEPKPSGDSLKTD